MSIYGVRGPDPRNTVVPAPTRAAAVDMLTPRDVLMVKEGACSHTNQCRCEGSWRDTAACRNCGQEITTWHPYPLPLAVEWTHVAGGAWLCQNGTRGSAVPEEWADVARARADHA